MWPPTDFDYDAALKRHGYRQVAVADWLDEPEESQDTGLRKVGNFLSSYVEQGLGNGK